MMNKCTKTTAEIFNESQLKRWMNKLIISSSICIQNYIHDIVFFPSFLHVHPTIIWYAQKIRKTYDQRTNNIVMSSTCVFFFGISGI